MDLVDKNVCTGDIGRGDGAFAGKLTKQRIGQKACGCGIDTFVGMGDGLVDALGGAGGMDDEGSFRGLRSAIGDGGGFVFFQKLMHEQDARHILDLLITHTECHFLHRTIGQALIIVTENDNVAQTKLFLVGQQQF